MRIKALLLLVGMFSAPLMAHEFESWSCWAQASRKHGVPVSLLKAIAKNESGFNAQAVGKNENGSYDIGLMQINTWWLAPNAPLGRVGVKRSDLFDPCMNVHVGAWILKQNFQKFGKNWRAVGAYNAVSEYKRVNYANKIYRTFKKGEIS